MSLNDEIGNFSKRREVVVKEKFEASYDEDAYEYDDWDDEDDDSSAYDYLTFKMYKLHDLRKFNKEVEELHLLISPWWKNLRVIFKKSTLGKIGLLDYKKKSLLSDDVFEEVEIRNVEDSLNELKIFDKSLKKSYHRYFMFNIYWILFYIPFIYWTGWSLIWYFLLAWSLFDMGLRYFKYEKHKEWLLKAETFIKAQNDNESRFEPEETNEHKLAAIMEFNEAIRKQENEHWSIRVYDAIENLFTRKK